MHGGVRRGKDYRPQRCLCGHLRKHHLRSGPVLARGEKGRFKARPGSGLRCLVKGCLKCVKFVREGEQTEWQMKATGTSS